MAEWLPTNPPAPHTVAIAQQIRREFGFGGANFPGAAELYAAATKIEAWAWATARGDRTPTGRLVGIKAQIDGETVILHPNDVVLVYEEETRTESPDA